MANTNDRDRPHRRDDDDADLEAADRTDRGDERPAADPLHPNPPFTKTRYMTAPKFGSAGSGGAENEPGPERD